MAKKHKNNTARRKAPQNMYRPPDYAAPYQAAGGLPAAERERRPNEQNHPVKRRKRSRPPQNAGASALRPEDAYHTTRHKTRDVKPFTMREARREARREQRRKYIKPLGNNTVDLVYRLLVISAFLAIALFTLSTFFGVHNIDVENSEHYLSPEVTEASGITEGDKLFFINRGKAAEDIIAKLPYIKAVRIRIKLPTTVIIDVTERKPAARLMIGGFEYIIDSECYLLQSTALKTNKTLPVIKCEKPVTLEPGKQLVFSNELLNSTLQDIFKYIVDTSFIGKISDIDVEKVYDVSFMYEDRLKIRLGDTGEVEKKLLMLNEVCKRLEDDATGEIDLRNPDSVRYMKK